MCPLEVDDDGQRAAQPLELARRDDRPAAGLGRDDRREQVGSRQRGEAAVRVGDERGDEIRVQVPAGPSADLCHDGHRRARPRGRGVGQDRLFGDVHDPPDQRQLVAAPPGGDAQAVEPLVHVVEGVDRERQDTEPLPQRTARLAPVGGRHRTLGRRDVREALREHRSALRAGPRPERRELRAEHGRVARVEHLQRGLEGRVIVEERRVARRVGRAADGPQQRRLEHREPILRGQPEDGRELRRDEAGA